MSLLSKTKEKVKGIRKSARGMWWDVSHMVPFAINKVKKRVGKGIKKIKELSEERNDIAFEKVGLTERIKIRGNQGYVTWQKPVNPYQGARGLAFLAVRRLGKYDIVRVPVGILLIKTSSGYTSRIVNSRGTIIERGIPSFEKAMRKAKKLAKYF